MVCGKCLKLSKSTKLATPDVKKRNDIYYGSPASASASTAAAGSKSRSATLGNAGISKSKLLSKAAKNPYAQYASSCGKCKTKITQGHTFCQKCAYTSDTCAMCGKPNKKSSSGAPSVTGQKFTLK